MSTIPVNVQIPSAAEAPIVADFVEHALRVAYLHRAHLKSPPGEEWLCPGMYLLLTGDGSGQVYVGQATDLRKRLLEHNRRPKLPWTRAVAIRRDTTLPPHMMLSLDALLGSMLAALRLAGVDIAKEADEPEPDQDSRRKRGHTRIGGTVADLVAAGLIRAGEELHLAQGEVTATGSVAANGAIVVKGVAYASPSKAAAKALGLQSSNGWTTWHVGSMDGPTLDHYRRRCLAADRADQG